MKKRILASLITTMLLFTLLSQNVLAAGALTNFKTVKTYTAGMFSDVPQAEWYADEVALAYEYGLVNGKTATTFEPASNLTIAEAIKMAAVLHSIYNTGSSTLSNGNPWYQTYVDYALQNNIITSPFGNYNLNATRADFARIFAAALPSDALSPINEVKDNAIPDVSPSAVYGPSVYLLYRAGILTGSGDTRAFKPNDNIKRSEVAAITARMVNTGNRVAFSLPANGTTTNQNAVIQASSSSVSLAVGGRATIMITDPSGQEDYNVSCIISDSKAATFFWGEWIDNYSCPLYIEGLAAGKATLTVKLLDAQDNILATTAVELTVTGSGTYTAAYYPGYTRVPDFGAYTGTPLDSTSESAGAASFKYRLDKIPVNMDITYSGYMNLLEMNLFAYVKAENDSQGNICFYYENSKYQISFGMVQDGAYQYMEIKVSPTPHAAFSITSSSSAVTLAKGSQTSVTITDPSGYIDLDFSYSVSDESVVSCSWGPWIDAYSCPFTITGLKAGSAVIIIYLFDADDNVLASTIINVTVTG